MHHAVHRRRLLAAATASTIAMRALLAGQRAFAQTGQRTIADTLAADDRFTNFLEMAARAGFVDQLRGPGPFTIFAPTDAAMMRAPAGMLQDLVGQGTGGGGGGTLSGASPDMVRLRAFLEYYAVRGLHPAAALAPDQRLRTVNGADLQVVAAPGGGLAVVNPAPGQQIRGLGASGLNVMPPAPITQADVPASNGIIHVLGGVVFP